MNLGDDFRIERPENVTLPAALADLGAPPASETLATDLSSGDRNREHVISVSEQDLHKSSEDHRQDGQNQQRVPQYDGGRMEAQIMIGLLTGEKFRCQGNFSVSSVWNR